VADNRTRRVKSEASPGRMCGVGPRSKNGLVGIFVLPQQDNVTAIGYVLDGLSKDP